jgi:protoheme ferro-lyase
VAFITPGEDLRNEWLEPVTDEQYDELPQSGESAGPR